MNNKKSKNVYRLLPCYKHDILAIETWLEDMAAEGYILKKLKTGYAIFVMDEPVQMRYRLLPRVENSLINIGGTPTEEDQFIAVQQMTGWKHITQNGFYFVFATQDPSLPELERDVSAIIKKTVKTCRNGAFVILFIWVSTFITLFCRGRLDLISIIQVGTWVPLLMVLIAASQIIDGFAAYRLQKKFSTDIVSCDWRQDAKQYKRQNIWHDISFALIIVFLSGAWGSVFYHWDKPKELSQADAPFPILEEIAPELSYNSDNIYYIANKKFDLLAPVVMTVEEHGALYNGDEQVFAGTLYIDYYETISPWIANRIANEYIYEDSFVWRKYKLGGEPNPVELNGLGVDYAYMQETHAPIVVLVEENVVIHIYYVNDADSDYINVDKLAHVYAEYLLNRS